VVDGGEPGVDSRDEGKHTGRNDLLFVEKMMWMDERVWSGFACCTVNVTIPTADHPECGSAGAQFTKYLIRFITRLS